EWLQRHIYLVVYAFFALVILNVLLRTLHRRFGILQPLVRLKTGITGIRLVQEIGFMFHFLKHPIDAMQELKENRRATVRSATILYGWLLLLQVLLVFAKGYL